MAVTLAHIESESSDNTYEIRIGEDLRCYCTCPIWKFGKQPFVFRNERIKSCKHLQKFMTTGMDIVGEEIRVPTQAKGVEFQIRALLLD